MTTATDDQQWVASELRRHDQYQELLRSVGMMLPSMLRRDVKAARLQSIRREMGLGAALIAAEERLLTWLLEQVPEDGGEAQSRPVDATDAPIAAFRSVSIRSQK